MAFKLSRSSKKNIKGIDKRLIDLVNRVLAKTEVDFGIPSNGGSRTAQEQNNLFHQRPKVTQLDGFKNKSYHQSGNAFDIFVYDEHGACWDCKDKYKQIADLFKEEYKIMKEESIFEDAEIFSWGGDWIRFKDLPHFQISK
jgi:peptidoglycan L-alanyl-D-glutamate endopeptidase CwlK|tara:strand:+ start:161 stop:583 length:423 start_codon:yes stop_codon:yes gene_type:complete